MNTTERNYLKGRIDEIYRDKKQVIDRQENKARDEHKLVKRNDILAALRNNIVSVKKDAKLSDWEAFDTPLKDVFDFRKFKEKLSKFDTAPYDTARDALQAERVRIRDQVMLGNAQEAIVLLEDFQKFQP